jgi:hypothetical protein
MRILPVSDVGVLEIDSRRHPLVWGDAMNKLLLIVAAAESLTGLVSLMWLQLVVRFLFGTEIAVCSTSRFGLTIRA